MNVIGFDVETHLIKPGLVAPKLVCLSTSEGWLFSPKAGIDWFRARLLDGSILVAHNGPYDVGVLVAEDPSLLPLVFDAYEQGRIRCTEIRERLSNNRTGHLQFDRRGKKVSYSLAAIMLARFGETLEKDNTPRLRYALLDGKDPATWTEEERQYAILDAVAAKRVFDDQGRDLFADEIRQTCAAFWLHLSSSWGIRTDATKVRALKRRLERRVRKLERFYIGSAFVREDGTRDMKAIRAALEPLGRGRTPTGLPETSAEDLEATGLIPLRALAAVSRAQKLLGTYLPVLEAGTRHPLCPSYVTIVETGRTSCREPNIQNVPTFPGVMECYVPRKGYVFGDADYDTLELRVLAQRCLDRFGFSKMAEAIRAGQDLHTRFAARVLGLAYEQVDLTIKQHQEARKLAKAFNFGVPGGLGATTFIEFARATYGVILTPAQFKAYKALYFQEFPELALHLKHAGQATEHGAGYLGPPLLSIERGDLSYCKFANILFQGPAAAGAKEAGWMLTRACYDPASVLYGSRIVAFIHDAFLMEHPEANAAERLEEQKRIMVLGMRAICRDVPVSVSAKLKKEWSK